MLMPEQQQFISVDEQHVDLDMHHSIETYQPAFQGEVQFVQEMHHEPIGDRGFSSQ